MRSLCLSCFISKFVIISPLLRSRYVMLCNESERAKFADALDEYKQIEKVLRHYCHDREVPDDEEVSF